MLPGGRLRTPINGDGFMECPSLLPILFTRTRGASCSPGQCFARWLRKAARQWMLRLAPLLAECWPCASPFIAIGRALSKKGGRRSCYPSNGSLRAFHFRWSDSRRRIRPSPHCSGRCASCRIFAFISCREAVGPVAGATISKRTAAMWAGPGRAGPAATLAARSDGRTDLPDAARSCFGSQPRPAGELAACTQRYSSAELLQIAGGPSGVYPTALV